MFSHTTEEITILITYLINWTSCICMKNATRLEVEICVTALETPIQTQFCFTSTAPVNCFSLLSMFWAHDISCLWLRLLFCGRNFLWEMTLSQSLWRWFHWRRAIYRVKDGTRVFVKPCGRRSQNFRGCVPLLCCVEQYVIMELLITTSSNLMNNFVYHLEPSFHSSK